MKNNSRTYKLSELVDLQQRGAKNHRSSCEYCGSPNGRPFVISYAKSEKINIEPYSSNQIITKCKDFKVHTVYICNKCIRNQFRKDIIFGILSAIFFIFSCVCLVPLLIGAYIYNIIDQITWNGFFACVFIILLIPLLCSLAILYTHIFSKIEGRSMAVNLYKNKLLNQGYDYIWVYPPKNVNVVEEYVTRE